MPLASHLEVFPPLKPIDTPINASFLRYIRRMARRSSVEICGLIQRRAIFFLKNLSISPNEYFIIDPKQYLKISTNYKIDYCFHSHPSSSCFLSFSDYEFSDNALIPFLIFSVPGDNFSLYDPKTQETIYFSI